VVLGLVLAIWLFFRQPLLFRQPLRSSSRYVLLLFTALCLRHSCYHHKPSFQSFICRLLLYFLASPFTWLLIGHPQERDAAANGVRLIFLDPFDVGVHTVQSRCLPSTCFSWSAMVTTSGAPNTASSTTSSIDSSLVRFLAFPLFLSRGPIAVIPCHAESTLHPTAGNRLKMHHYAHGSHAKMLINYTAPFIYTLPDPDKVL